MAHAPPIGSKGGLLLAWRNGVDLECFVTNANTISAWCYSDPVHTPWMLSCVYGSPYSHNRSQFWDNLMEIGANFSRAWLCIGDFNMILGQSEKSGGLPDACSSRDFFHDFLNVFGMIDLGFFGNPYTWSNHRDSCHQIKQRLDRGVASPSWFSLFPSFALRHLPDDSSNHNPLLLDTSVVQNSLPYPFRFEDFWIHHPECLSVIMAAWDALALGSPAFVLVRRLKSTKKALKTWNSLSFGNIQSKIHSLTKFLDDIQQSASNLVAYSLESNIRFELDSLYLQEETLWHSKSRDTWLTCKDLNTKYFHLSTLIKRRRNAIDFLKLNTGTWISDRRVIGNSFCNHFANLFSSSGPSDSLEYLPLFDPVITDAINQDICCIPLEQEIFEALLSISATKAPGPDGFTSLFYQTYWSIVKEVVLNCVWDFFSYHHLLKEQNHTFIALIPKRLGPFLASHFRPISLCNIIYKIISKILVNRLKGLLHLFISPINRPLFLHDLYRTILLWHRN